MKIKPTYLIIIALGFIIIYLSTCRRQPTKIEKITEHFRDTIRIQNIDTFIIVKEHRNLTVFLHDTIILSDPIDTSKIYNTYTSNVADSLLEAFITVKSETRPFIDFKYELKQFEITNITTIKDSTFVEIRKGFLSIGATLLGNKNNFGFAPVIQYNRKSGLTYNIGFDVINKSFHVGFTTRISFKKK